MQSRTSINLGVTFIAVLTMALSAALWVLTGIPSWYDQLCLCLGFVLAGASSVLGIMSLPHATSEPEVWSEKWARICLGAALLFVTIRGPLVAIFG